MSSRAHRFARRTCGRAAAERGGRAGGTVRRRGAAQPVAAQRGAAGARAALRRRCQPAQQAGRGGRYQVIATRLRTLPRVRNAVSIVSGMLSTRLCAGQLASHQPYPILPRIGRRESLVSSRQVAGVFGAHDRGAADAARGGAADPHRRGQRRRRAAVRDRAGSPPRVRRSEGAQ